MTKRLTRAICLLLTIALAPLPSLAKTAKEHDLALDKILGDYRTTGAAICVFQNGEIVYSHNYGLADIGASVKADDNTLYRIGSISKLISAIGLMQLYEKGAFALDDDISALLGAPIRNPQYPLAPVTVRQVLTHTAGLRDSGYYDLANRGADMTLDKLFSGDRLSYQFKSNSRPGARAAYSNLGGGLIGCLIEKLSGQALDDYMTQNVFAPLGITAAYQAHRIPEDIVIAKQYDTSGGLRITDPRKPPLPPHDEPDPQRAFMYTAGKLIISAKDLTKLMIALCDGGIYGDVRLLKPSTAELMLTRQDCVGSVTVDSGRGLSVCISTDAEVDGRTLYGHAGRSGGMLCAAHFDPTDRTGVIMLTNGCDNQRFYRGAGLLTRAVFTYCYGQIIGETEGYVDPFLVNE